MSDDRAPLRLAPAPGAFAGHDTPRWRNPPPLQSRLFRTSHGIGVDLQGRMAVEPELTASGVHHEALVLLIWRSGARLDATLLEDLPGVQVGPGAFAVLSSESPSWWALRDNPVDDNLHIYLDRALVSEICQRDGMKSVPRFDGLVGSTNPLVAQLGEHFVELVDAEHDPSRQHLDALVTLLVLQLARLSHEHVSPIHRPQIRKGGLAGWQIRRTTEYIHAHLHENIALTELAAIAGLSPFHFARAFKQSVGDPPHRYQIRKRLEKACEMLAGTALPVIDIAAAVGYETPQTLSRLFRREFGVSPSFYRREKTR